MWLVLISMLRLLLSVGAVSCAARMTVGPGKRFCGDSCLNTMSEEWWCLWDVVPVSVQAEECLYCFQYMLKRMFSGGKDAGTDGRFMPNTECCFLLKGGYIFHYEYVITKVSQLHMMAGFLHLL